MRRQQHIRRRQEVVHWDNRDSKTTGRVAQQHTRRRPDVVAGRTFADAREVVHRKTSTRGLPQGWPARRSKTTQSCPREQHRLGNSPEVVPWSPSTRRRPDGWREAVPGRPGGARRTLCSIEQSGECQTRWRRMPGSTARRLERSRTFRPCKWTGIRGWPDRLPCAGATPG
jgi:hypothetical protein